LQITDRQLELPFALLQITDRQLELPFTLSRFSRWQLEMSSGRLRILNGELSREGSCCHLNVFTSSEHMPSPAGNQCALLACRCLMGQVDRHDRYLDATPPFG